MTRDPDQRVKLLTLREHVSEGGKRYFRGWLGDAVVLVFEDADTPPEYGAVATWAAYVVPRRPKVSAGAAETKAPRPKPVSRAVQPELHLKQAPRSRTHPGLEDEIGVVAMLIDTELMARLLPKAADERRRAAAAQIVVLDAGVPCCAPETVVLLRIAADLDAIAYEIEEGEE